MKQIAMILATALLAGVAPAQPNLNTAPKAANPPNRDAALRAAQKQKGLRENLQKRTAKRVEQRLTRLPVMLTALGVTEAKTQEAIAAHFRTALTAREPLLEAQLKLRRALLVKTTSETQLKAAVEAHYSARKEYEASFQKALNSLNDRISFRQNARLEAALLAIGALEPDGVNSSF